jgi:predicted PolB exonuclease-like 3'-5' exonuclease
MGHSGAEVWEQFQAGAIEDIRNYCETDVLNTYLVYLRFELMRGNLDDVQYQKELTVVRDALDATGKPHLSRFLSAWPAQPAR